MVLSWNLEVCRWSISAKASRLWCSALTSGLTFGASSMIIIIGSAYAAVLHHGAFSHEWDGIQERSMG